MTLLKSAARRVVLFAVGLVVGMGLFLLAGFVLAVLGYGLGGYAVANAYFVVIILCLIAAVAAYFRTKGWAPSKRLNLAIFLTGVVALPLIEGLQILFTTPQYLIFWPR